MHSVFTLDIATLIHLSISYLVSSLPSSWIINSSASTHMTGKSTIFFTFHTSSTPSIVLLMVVPNVVLPLAWQSHFSRTQ